MPDDASAVLNLPYIQPSQAQKHVTHNEALRLLDVLVQLVVTDRSLTVPPAAHGAGARYIVAAGAGGPWAGQEGAIALHEAGGWQFFVPQPGWSAHVLAEAVTVVFDGVNWRAPVEEPQLFLNWASIPAPVRRTVWRWRRRPRCSAMWATGTR